MSAGRKRHTKLSRVLLALGQGQSLNRFEAVHKLRDWCLHSTVASIQRHGIYVDRKPETVPGYQGAPTRVMRYRILPADRKKARELAKQMKKPRAASTTRGQTEGQAHVQCKA